ncbi:hypothetical protein PVAP13_2KG461400 [Panicum virgatum]|uniref:Uncharacterized protein n=1 Tax=Panicum virgatum TaxID=38727 RepID=A0A8T0WI85_PANVG|nr:hypothetical protein PVAP13_2KG461400 [Panicum virgatum]
MDPRAKHGSSAAPTARATAAQAARFGRMPPLYILLSHLPLILDLLFQQSSHKNRKERSLAAPHQFAPRHPPPPPPRVGEEDQPLASQAQKLPCAHLYHFYCIVTWLESAASKSPLRRELHHRSRTRRPRGLPSALPSPVPRLRTRARG